jgi:hypothetical protein
VAKNKGKRNRSQRSSAPTPSSTLAVGTVPAGLGAEADEHEVEGRESIAPDQRSTMSIEPTVSSDNVIPFPRSSQAATEARESKATLISGTGSFATPKVPADEVPAAATPAPETAKPAEDSALRPAAGEQERTTIPPEESTGERAKVAAAESPAAAEPKVSEKPAKPTEDETRKTLRGEVVGKKEEGRRTHKESLSTHLSDEAKAFFSEAAAGAAYKQTHDTFEDLAPASEDHAAELARSKRAMTITGVLLIGVIAVVAGFGIYSRTSVPETGLERHPSAIEAPTPTAANPTPPAAEPTPPPAAEPTPPPVAAATPPAAEPTPPSPTAPEPAPAAAPAPAPVAAAAPPVAAPAAAPAPPAPVAAPTGQTPQQMLAAARSFRGPFAGKLAAYNAYFDANPTDDRTMTTYAMSLAEGAHNAEAEAVANRAVTANPRSGQAWFVLAYARSQQHNREGAAEARTRCIAIGGTWANECRAIR